jgi:alanyl-tRNA synthetase
MSEMVEKLYYADPYLKSFDAVVTKVIGDKVFLDRTAFYPGGGGQAHDTGTINGNKVVEVDKDGDEISHRILGGNFKQGQKVRCEVDWARRHELMRGHSGQHILFRAMQEQNPELSVGKVDITIEKKTLFFNGEMSWQSLKAAVARANEIIAADVPLAIQEVSRDSPSLEKVRIKADKITGDRVRVVKIGEFDAAACGGVHVKSSGEIGGIAVVKLVSGRQASDWSVQFEIGSKAIQATSALALSTLSISNSLGCAPENAEPTVANLKAEVASLSEKLKASSQKQLDALGPEKIGDFSLYYIILYGADRKTMSDSASKIIREPGAIVLMCDIAENVFMMVACNEKIAIDCPALLKKGLEIVGGRGGGKMNFAQGGGADVSKAEEAFKVVKQSILDILASQFTCG